MKSVRSSRRHGKRSGKFVFEIRQRLCGLCLVGKIVPEDYTTMLKAPTKDGDIICLGQSQGSTRVGNLILMARCLVT